LYIAKRSFRQTARGFHTTFAATDSMKREIRSAGSFAVYVDMVKTFGAALIIFSEF
jgi:hypothetical protein